MALLRQEYLVPILLLVKECILLLVEYEKVLFIQHHIGFLGIIISAGALLLGTEIGLLSACCSSAIGYEWLHHWLLWYLKILFALAELILRIWVKCIHHALAFLLLVLIQLEWLYLCCIVAIIRVACAAVVSILEVWLRCQAHIVCLWLLGILVWIVKVPYIWRIIFALDIEPLVFVV